MRKTEPWHGTYNGYVYHKCRRDCCRTAYNIYQRNRRVQRYGMPIPSTVAHGKASTYINWGCRCHACGDASAAAKRKYRQSRR